MTNNTIQPSRNNVTRGLLIMAGGVILLLHTMGLLQKGSSFILIILSVLAIVYGLYISGLYDKLMSLTHKKQ
jgi:hypothetical protein